MKIQKLLFGKSKIDLAVLPTSLRTLTIDSARKVICSCGQMILENLHHLTLSELSSRERPLLNNEEDYSTVLKHIKCTNLVSLCMEDYDRSYDKQYLPINSDLIPNSVKRLSLGGIKINWIEGHKDLKVEKLVLFDYSFRSIKKFCKVLVAVKELVISCPEKFGGNDNVRPFLKYLHLKNYFGGWMKRIYIGPFDWEENAFKKSLLLKYVDKESKYYVFENQEGKGLDLDWHQLNRILDIHE